VAPNISRYHATGRIEVGDGDADVVDVGQHASGGVDVDVVVRVPCAALLVTDQAHEAPPRRGAGRG
jgi:hypothetical protein